MNLKSYIHLLGKGDKFRIFVNEQGYLPTSAESSVKYFSSCAANECGFSFFWAEDEYEISSAGEWVTLDSLNSLPNDQGAHLCCCLSYFWEFMPDSQDELGVDILPRTYGLKNPRLNNVTFFGGSFYPWHQGHRECIEQALRHGRNVIVVPDQNPWKEGRHRACSWLSFKQLCLELEETAFSVFPGFLGLHRSNPTVRWIPLVKLKHKSLLMGDDSFFGLHLWKNVEELLKNLHSIYVVPREGKQKQRLAQMELLQKINPDLAFFFLENHPHEAISSTKIRESQN